MSKVVASECSGRRIYRTTKMRGTAALARGEQASVTLEASLWLPVFLTFMLALIALLKICMTDLALEAAVSDSVKTIAASSYPVKVLADEVAASSIGSGVKQKKDALDRWYKQVADWQSWIGLSFLPDSLKEWFAFAGEWRDKRTDGLIQQASAPLRGWLAAYIASQADERLIRKSNLEVTELDLPDLWWGGDAYLTVTARYKIEIPLPFYRIDMTLTKRVSERCWFGS